MPLAAGTVGGATGVSDCARASFELLGVDSAGDLAVVMAAAGLKRDQDARGFSGVILRAL